MTPSEQEAAPREKEAAEPDSRQGPGAGGDEAGPRADPVGGPDADSDADSGSGEGAFETARAPAAADDEPAETAPAPEDLATLRAERDQARDRHLRLAADFDNYRKRTEDRLRRRWDRAQADLVSRLLEPLDDLLRVTALEPETASVGAIVEGVDLVERKFSRLLREAGVEVVDPGGEPFDPNTMEAMMRVPAGSEDDDDVVERVFQRGYTFKGLLIRPARVSVYKA